MKIMVPMKITHSRLLSSNLAEDDEATEWDVATTYNTGDEVYKDEPSGHRIYRSSADSNLGNDPEDGGDWVNLEEWTNRWKCLKTDTGQATIADDSTGIEYELDTTQPCSEVAFKGLRCSSVRLVVKNASAVTIYDETKTGTETVIGSSWYISDMLFTNLPIDNDSTVEITIADPPGSDVAAVGQILMGYSNTLGRLEKDVAVGFEDLARKEQDEYGKFSFTERGVSDVGTFVFSHQTSLGWWVKSVLANSRTNPCLYWDSEASVDDGTMIFGYADDPEIDYGSRMTLTTLEVTGVSYTPYGSV